MSERSNRRQFELEELEKKLYLSAVPVPVLPYWHQATTVRHHPTTVVNTRVAPGEAGAVADHALDYDPAAQAGSIFDGVTPAPTSDPEANSDSGTSEPEATHAAGSAEAQSDAAVTEATPVLTGSAQVQTKAETATTTSSQVQGSTASAELVQTLNAANGPPAAAGTATVTSQSTTTSAEGGTSGSPQPLDAMPPQDLYAFLISSSFTSLAVNASVTVDNLTLDNGLFQLGSLTLTKTDSSNDASIAVALSASGMGTFSIDSSVSASFTLSVGAFTSGANPSISLTLSDVSISINSFITAGASASSISVTFNPIANTSLTLNNGSIKTAKELTLSVTGASLFAGLNGPVSNPNAVGFSVTGANLGLAIFESTDNNTYYALSATSGTASATTGLSGPPGSNLTLQADGTLAFEVNASTDPSQAVVAFQSSFGGSGLSVGSVNIDFQDPLLDASGNVTLKILSGSDTVMTLTGTVEIQSTTVSDSEPQVTVGGAGLGGAQLITVGGTGLAAAEGSFSGNTLTTGVSLSNVAVGMAIVQDASGNTYWGLESTAGSSMTASAELVNLPSDFALTINNLFLEINQYSGLSATGVADFSVLSVPTGGTPLELTDLTSSNGAMVQFGGTVTMALDGFVTFEGTVAFASRTTPASVTPTPGSVTPPAGSTLAPTMLTVGGVRINMFVGLSGSFDSSATTAPYFIGKGVELDDVSFGLAIVQDTNGHTYWGLKSDATSAELVGLPSGFELTASDLSVEVNWSNNGSATATFDKMDVARGGSNTGSEELDLTGQLFEATGTVNLSVNGFAVLDGTISVESQQLTSGLNLSSGGTTDLGLLTITGADVHLFGGVNGAVSNTATSAPYFTGTGIELDDASFTLAIATSGVYSYWGLQASATTVRFDGLPSGCSASLSNVTLKLNQSSDNTGPSNSMVVADFTSLTGLAGLPTSSPTLEVGADLKLELSSDLFHGDLFSSGVLRGGVLAEGTVTVSVQNVPAGLQTTDGNSVAGGNMLTIAGSGLNFFVGINGTFLNSSGSPYFDGTGLEIDSVDFALVMIDSGGFNYWALNTTAGTPTIIGLPLGISVPLLPVTNLQFEVNQSNNLNGANNSMIVADFSQLTSGSLAVAGTSLTIDYSQPKLEAFGQVTLDLGNNVSISGEMALSIQTVSGGLTLTDGSTLTDPASSNLTILTIGGSDVTAYFGKDATTSNPVGLELDNGGFGLVLAQDATDTYHYWALRVEGGTVKTDNLAISTITATNFDLQLNQSDNNSGLGGSMVVVDFTQLPIPSGQTESGLAVPTSPSSYIYLDFGGPTESFAGSASIAIPGVPLTLSGNFVFTVSSSGPELFDVGETDLNFNVQAGSTNVLSFSQGSGQEGGFIITQSGDIAGSATLQFQTGLVSLSGTITISINTTGAAASGTVDVPGGGTYSFSLPYPPDFQIEISSGDIHFGSAAIPIPTIYVVFSGGNVELQDGSMQPLIDIDSSGNITEDSAFISLLSSLPGASLLNHPDPSELVLGLEQIVSWLTSLSGSSLLQTQIPFTSGTTIGQALDFAQAFISQVYSYMVNIELQSSLQSSSSVSGSFSGDTMTFEIGSGTTPAFGSAQTITLNGSYSNVNDIITILNNAISANSSLSGKVVAQTDADGFLSITLTQQAIANGDTALEMTSDSGTSALQSIGFPLASSLGNPIMAVLKPAYNFNPSDPGLYISTPGTPESQESFFGEFEHLLAQIDPTDYASYTPPNSGQEVYTFPLSMTVPVASLTEPFSFSQSFGPIGSATLTGSIGLTPTVTLSLTLGFDMTAASVPVVISSGAIPVPSTGVLEPGNDANFTVELNNNAPISLTLAASDTTTNTDAQQLVVELNNVLAGDGSPNYTLDGQSVNLGQVLIAKLAGNQISISARTGSDALVSNGGNGTDYLGIVNSIEITTAANDPFATELGFGAHVSPTDSSMVYTEATSPIKGLFIEGNGSSAPTVSGTIDISTPTPISGTLQLGFVTASTSGGVLGTYDLDGHTLAPLSVSLSLQSQNNGSDRFYLSDLMNAITSGGISTNITGPTLSGSFLLSLNNISVSGLGFSLPLSNPSITLWIPDITNLNYNGNAYQANDPSANKGLFITFPNLGPLPDLSNLSFNQILTALQGVASSLSQLSAFSFLNQPLPLINESINSLLDYAGQVSSLIAGLGSSGISSLQSFITQLNTEIEQTLHLSPGVLTISLDDGGLFGTTATASSDPTAVVNLAPDSNNSDTVTISTTDAGLSGATIRVLNNSSATSPTVNWDATTKTLTITVNNQSTTVDDVYAAINAAGTPWQATAETNSTDVVNVSSLVTAGGTATVAARTTIMPAGPNNDFTITADSPGTDMNGSTVVIVGSSNVSGDTAVANWNALGQILTIQINPGTTDANAIVTAINNAHSNNNATMPWTAAPTSNDPGPSTANSGAGVIRTFALKVKLDLSVAYAKQMPFSLNLQDLFNLAGNNPVLEQLANVVSSFVAANADGSLNVTLGANLTLDFGLDLTNPLSIQPFFYTDTGVALTAKISAQNLNFTLNIAGGIIQVSIQNGTAALSLDGGVNSGPATISLSLKDTDGSGRLYLSGDWFSTSNLTLTMQGGLSAVLPVFVEGVALGSTDVQPNGFPGNALVVQIPDLYRFFTGSAKVSTTTGSATINLAGVSSALVISATGITNFSVRLQTGAIAVPPTFDINTNTLTITILTDGSTTISDVQNALTTVIGAPVGGSFSASSSASSDTAIPGSAIYFAAPDFSSLFNGLNFTTLLENNPLLLLTSLDNLLGSIENGLNSIASRTSLPLVGNGLTKAADFIGRFRSGLLAELENDIRAAGGNVQSAVQKALWAVLGGGGLNILANPNTGAPLTSAQQIDVEFTAQKGLVVNLELASKLNLVDTSGNPINVNLGVPGLNFTAQGNVSVSIGYTMLFSFGLNLHDGFYFKTPDSITLSFDAAIPGLTFTGNLAFLQLQISDDSTNPSYFKGAFNITLNAPDGGDKITGDMLTSGLDLSQVLQSSLTATANLNFDLVASFGGNTAFPSLDAEFHLRWDWTAGQGADAPKVWFDNVGLDLGSFISSFLGPILNEVQKVTEPVQPVIDLVTARIPILSDLVGHTVTLLSLAQTFGLVDPGTEKFINEVAQIVTLINDIHTMGSGDIILPMGAFSLGYDASGNMTQVQVTTVADLSNIGVSIQAASGSSSSSFTSNAKDFMKALSGMQGLTFPFIQKPASLFNLFVGKDVTLIQWQLPQFNFQFTYKQVIPLFPPLVIDFGGSLSAAINIGFGYDTYGLREIFNDPSHKASDLLDGFFIITTDQNNQPLPALTLTGQIFAGLELDLGVISGGVNGGISATINFNWNDSSDNDGKLRFAEIAADAAQGAECIFDMTGSVNIFLNAFVKSPIFKKTWDFGNITLADFSVSCPTPVLGSMSGGVLTLNIGSLASQRKVGDTSDDSENFIIRDQGPSAGGGETVSVTFNNEENTFTGVTDIRVLNPGQGNNVLDFRGVTVPVYVTSGPGNDTIYLSDGANSYVYCGSGNDTVICSPKASATGVVIYGGTGNDTITGGAAPIVIFGGAGNNVITGSSSGGDVIIGGGGNDTITAGGGTGSSPGEIIITGPGNNIVTVANGSNAVSASGGVHNFILADSWLFVMGDINNASNFVNNVLKVATGGSLAAAIWNDMTSSTQTELTSGSLTPSQEEVILVGQLDAIMLQDQDLDPNHPLAGTPASLYSYLPSAVQTSYPSAQGQTVIELERSLMASSFSSYVNPRITGGGTDTITGGADGDVIDGGAGNDIIYGGAGNDLLIAGAGSSQVYGAGGNDLIIGGEISMISNSTNSDVAIMPANIATLLDIVNGMYVASGNNVGGVDVQGLNGGGNDLLVGSGGSDALFGGAGNDQIYGGNLLIEGNNVPVTTDGNNFIAGGQGNDTIFTDDASSSSPTPTPTGISIKSSIWYDAGNEYTRLSTDTGFAGVTVSLYLASSPSTPVATTMTDATGNYEFDGLSPATYYVTFSLPATPSDLSFVPETHNGSPTGSDVDASGTTSPFTLSLNETYTEASAGYQSSTPAIVSVSNPTVTLSSSTTTAMVFTITISGALPYSVDVTYSTVDAAALGGIAAYPGSFDAVSGGTVTLAAGQTSTQVTIQIEPSSTYGPNTQFELQVTDAELQNPTGLVPLTIANTGVGTIINNNPIPVINISSFDPGNTAFQITVGDAFNTLDLATLLKAHADPVSSALFALDGSAPAWTTLESLTLTGLGAASAQTIQADLLAVLNDIIQGPNIYSSIASAGVTLSLPTIGLLAQQPTVSGQTLIALNRLVLQDAYPSDIPGGAAYNPNFVNSDFLDPAGLAAALASQNTAVEQYIWGTISSADQATLTNPATTTSDLVSTLETDLNALIAVASSDTAHNDLFTAAQTDLAANPPLFSSTAVITFLAAQNPQGNNLALFNALIVRQALNSDLAQINTTPASVNMSSVFAPGDLFDPSAFLTTLEGSQFWSLVPADTQNTLMGVGSPSLAQISTALASAVNGLLQNPVSLDTATSALTTFFGTVTRSNYTYYLESTNPQHNDLIRLNRFLLDDAYPTQLGQISGYEGTTETFTVTLSNPSVDTITVNWQTDIAVTLGGALESDSAFPVGFSDVSGNYQPVTNGVITFQPGVTSQVITVQTVANGLVQDDLHYYVNLSAPVDAGINQGHAFALIRNLDPPVTVTFAAFSPGYSGDPFATNVPAGGAVPLTVNLLHASGQVVTVNYSTSPGTATDAKASPDYDTQTGTITFQPGQISQTITITLQPTATSGDYFYVNLFNATNATIASSTGAPNRSNHVELYIGPAGSSSLPWSVYFSSSAYDVTESPTGDTTAAITIYHTPGSPDPVAVFFTSNGTATADTATTTGDYASVRQIVSFNGSADAVTVYITIHNDGTYDGNETVNLSLLNPTGGPVNGTPATAVLTIHDPAPPQLKIVQDAGSAVTAGGVATFTVELVDADGNPILPADNAQTITFQYYTNDITAISGTDYDGISYLPYATQATATIDPSSSSTTIQISTIAAANPGPTKTFGVIIDHPDNATVTTANSVAIGTIYNDTFAPVSGFIFYDANGNGVQDYGETGLADVTIEVTYGSGDTTGSTTAHTLSDGSFTAMVPEGVVGIQVQVSNLPSPTGQGGEGATYTNTTSNISQQINFSGTTGLDVFTPIGFTVATTNTPDPANSKDTGTGLTDSTAFGGPGNDSITAGGGIDNIVGGSWDNAVDANAPVNQVSHDVQVTVTNGRWYVTTSTTDTGSIIGTVLNEGVPVIGQAVTVFDSSGDPVSSAVTDSSGDYTLAGLYVGGQYVVQFATPAGDLLTLTGVTTVVIDNSLSNAITIASSSAVTLEASYSPAPSNVTPNYYGFHFDYSIYNVAENVPGGLLTITIDRTNTAPAVPVVIRTTDLTAMAGTNYTAISTIVEFAAGQASATITIPILNTNSIGFDNPALKFSVSLYAPTGAPYDRTDVFIGGADQPHITDNDTVHAGPGIDVVLGDSGNIPSSVDLTSNTNTPGGFGTIGDITYVGGSGNDTIYSSTGPVYINGGLGDDTFYVGLVPVGTLPIVQQVIVGGSGTSTLIVAQDVPNVIVDSSAGSPNSGTVTFEDANGQALGEASFSQIAKIELFGGAHTTNLQLTDWYNPAWIFAGPGQAAVSITIDSNLTLTDATVTQQNAFNASSGLGNDLSEFATLTLANDSVYYLGGPISTPQNPVDGLLNISLTGEATLRTFDASGYSGVVTFYNSAGGTIMMGGGGFDTFVFDADNTQGAATLSGNSGTYALDFSSTQTSTVNLDLEATNAQTVSTNLTLTIVTGLQNAAVIVGQADNNITVGDGGNHRIVFLPFGSPATSGTTTVTQTGSGIATLDFSAFTTTVNVDLNQPGLQQVAGFSVGYQLYLILTNAAVNNVIGGSDGGTLTGNANDDTFMLTFTDSNLLTSYTIDGGGGSNTLTVSGGSSYLLTGNALTVNSSSTPQVSFTNIQTVNLSDGPSNSTFTIDGFSGTVNLTGGAGFNLFAFNDFSGTANITADTGTNEVEVSTGDQGTVTITNDAIAYSGATINFAAVSNPEVVVNDTAGGNFDATGWTTGTLVLVGGGDVTVTVQSSATNQTVSNGLLDFPSGSAGVPDEIIQLFAVNNVTVTVTAAGVTFDATGWSSGTLTINGDGSTALETEAAAPGVITVGSGSVTFSGATVNFTGISQLTVTGSTGNDTFALQSSLNGTTLGLSLTGNGDDDTLDLSAFTAAVNVNLNQATPQTIIAGQLWTLTLPQTDIDNVVLGSGGGTVMLSNTSGAYTITGSAAASNTLIFSGGSSYALTSNSLTVNSASSPQVTLTNIQNVTLNGAVSGSDTFTFDPTGWLGGNVTLNGGSGGNDFILLPPGFALSQAVNVYCNGSLSGPNTLDVSAFPPTVPTLTNGTGTLIATDLTVYPDNITTFVYPS